MANIAYTKGEGGVNYTVYLWSGATNGGTPDTFTALELIRTPYSITMQTSGTFSGSASIALHGSLDGTNYAALADRSGAAIALTDASLIGAGDPVLYIKPVLTSGDGLADIDVTVLVRYDSF